MLCFWHCLHISGRRSLKTAVYAKLQKKGMSTQKKECFFKETGETGEPGETAGEQKSSYSVGPFLSLRRGQRRCQALCVFPSAVQRTPLTKGNLFFLGPILSLVFSFFSVFFWFLPFFPPRWVISVLLLFWGFGRCPVTGCRPAGQTWR